MAFGFSNPVGVQHGVFVSPARTECLMPQTTQLWDLMPNFQSVWQFSRHSFTCLHPRYSPNLQSFPPKKNAKCHKLRPNLPRAQPLWSSPAEIQSTDCRQCDKQTFMKHTLSPSIRSALSRIATTDFTPPSSCAIASSCSMAFLRFVAVVSEIPMWFWRSKAISWAASWTAAVCWVCAWERGFEQVGGKQARCFETIKSGRAPHTGAVYQQQKWIFVLIETIVLAMIYDVNVQAIPESIDIYLETRMFHDYSRLFSIHIKRFRENPICSANVNGTQISLPDLIQCYIQSWKHTRTEKSHCFNHQNLILADRRARIFDVKWPNSLMFRESYWMTVQTRRTTLNTATFLMAKAWRITKHCYGTLCHYTNMWPV